MNVLNQEHIRELIDHRSPLSVSLFMPTHRYGQDQQQDPIRLKNLIRDARDMMLGQADPTLEVDEVLQPAADLRSDDDYWRHRGDGLACFCAPELFRAYRVPIKLDERLSVSDRFQIRPLLPLLRSDARVYILALTQENARLFETTKYSIREIDLPDISQIEVDGNEQTLQYHSHKAPSRGKGPTETAMYHGQGGPGDRTKKDALRFFQLVDLAVTRVLRGQRSPLVLACVGYLSSLYELGNSYKYLLKGKVPGSPDRWNDDELRERAWQIAEPHFRQYRQQAWQQFQRASGLGRTADELRRVVLAANEGRVATLFLARGERRYGHVDPQLHAVHVVDDETVGEELLDYAASRTLGNGGDVFLLDSLPDTDSPVAATFRY